MRSSQLSHPYGNTFMGMARKIRYLLQLLTLASEQILVRDTIDAFTSARRASMSQSSCR